MNLLPVSPSASRAERTGARPGRSALFTALLLALLPALLVLASAGRSTAAAGSSFDPDNPVIFTSKSANAADPTGLYRLEPNAGGTYDFAQVGPDANLVYNALTFNTDDHFLYAITGDPLASGVPAGSLIKIGANGGYDVIGSSTFIEPGFQTNMGAYRPDTKQFYVLSAQGSKMYVIDLDPSSAGYGTLDDTITIDPADHNAQGGGSDFTYSRGAFWTLGSGGLFRINLDGSTNKYAVPAGAASSAGGADQAGAAWTFLGGDLGFSYNGSGEVVRIAVTDPTGTPSFTTVVKSGGSASGQNDGAAIPGTVDLAIEKTGALVDDGDGVSYTLEVTNNGGAVSNGWTVTDTLPKGLTDIDVTGAGTATVAGRKVTVVGGTLAVGATATIEISATVSDDAPSDLSNTARVTGVDPDPIASNNVDTVALDLPDDPTDEPSTDDVADAAADLDAPDTGAQHASTWQPLVAIGAGLALIAGLATRIVMARRRDEV